MLEAAFVFDDCGKILYWHEPKGRTAVSIDDSFNLWNVLWSFRKRLGGVCHSHPWKGEAMPSTTDLTTFAAVEKGLGERLIWPIVTIDDITYYLYDSLTGYYIGITTPPPFRGNNRWVNNIKELQLKSQRGYP